MRILGKLYSYVVARYLLTMNAPPKQSKFQAYRARKKALGLHEVRMWVPDTRSPAFIAEAKRQAALLDKSEDEREVTEVMELLSREALEDWR